MQDRRFVALISLLLVLMLVATGCAPRPGAGVTAAESAPDAVVVDLPALALDVAQDGSLSLGGIPLADLVGSFGLPADMLASVALDPAQVEQITGAGIQHVQLENRPNGLGIFVNGQEIPALNWSGDQLNNLAAFAGDQPALGALLPLVKQLGIGVTLRFPVAEGAEAAPLVVPSDQSAAASLVASEQKFVESVGNAGTVVVPVIYNADGSWSINGIAGDDLINLTGQTALSALNQNETQMAGVKKYGIKTISLATGSDGLNIAVNGAALPSLDWSGGKLASVIALAQDAGLLNLPGMDPQMLQSLLDQYLPMLTTTDIELRAVFPE